MGYQSDHDRVAEKARENAHQQLVDYYIELAIQASQGDDEDVYGFLNVRGHEVPDPTVLEPPLGYVPGPDLMEQMRAMVRRELSAIAEENAHETFEEADDFDIEDDPVDYTSPYELYFDPPPQAPQGPPSAVVADPSVPPGGSVEPPPQAPDVAEVPPQ